MSSLRTVQRTVFDNYKHLHEGQFCIDDLLRHLEFYNAPKVVSIGEDATRVIAWIEYDNETNRLVGFVLPCDSDGLPQCNTFTEDCLQSIENPFRMGTLAKYAFVYMAQTFPQGFPAFCLAYLGTGNKFSPELLFRWWNYIHLECKVRGIKVVSFGADGNSREMKVMQLSKSCNCLGSLQNNLLLRTCTYRTHFT